MTLSTKILNAKTKIARKMTNYFQGQRHVVVSLLGVATYHFSGQL